MARIPPPVAPVALSELKAWAKDDIVTLASVLVPVLIGLTHAAANSLVRIEHRRPLNAVVVVGAGAAYLSGGFGP